MIQMFKKEKKKKKNEEDAPKESDKKGAEGEGESSSVPMTPERLKEIVETVNSEGNLTSDKEYEFDDKVLREPAAYSGFAYSTFWDKEEDEDPANNVEIQSVYDDVRTPILLAEGCSVGPRPAWLQPLAQVLVLMLTKDGYLEQTPVAPPIRCLDKNSASSVLTQFSTLPLEQIHHFAYNGEYMNALFKDRKLVDILIHIEDRTFYGHRCMLCAHSGYFSSVLVDSSVPPYAITDITLKSIDPHQFKKFLNFAYTGEIFLTLANVESFRKLANKLKSKTLRAKIAVFLSKAKVITLDEALQILLDEVGGDEFLRPLAIETIIKNFKELLLDPARLCQFAKEDLLYILQADSLNVDSELDAFWAVLYWVAADPVERAPAMNRLMSAVRFTTMTSLELMDCARVSELVRLSRKCQAYLINANWVCHVREVGLQDPLGLSKEQKRSSLLQSKPHQPTVAEFDMRFLIYNALLKDQKGQIVQAAHGKDSEGKLHEHLGRMSIPSRANILSKKSVTFVTKDGKEAGTEEAGEKGKTGGKKEKKKKEKGSKGKKKGKSSNNVSGNYDEDVGGRLSSDGEPEEPRKHSNNAVISYDLSPETTLPFQGDANNISSSALPASSGTAAENRAGLIDFPESPAAFELEENRDNVDALQLWEKGNSSPTELLLLGGDILQPRKTFTVNLTRSRHGVEAETSGSCGSWQVPTSMEVEAEYRGRSSLEFTPSGGSSRSKQYVLPLTSKASFDADGDSSTADTSEQVTFPEFSEENPQENFNYGGYYIEPSSGQITTRSGHTRFPGNTHREHGGESRVSTGREISKPRENKPPRRKSHAMQSQTTDSQTNNIVTSRIRNTSSLDDPSTLAGLDDDLIHL
ncbi:hypothetical protein RRG08_038097 [Elysia crispata]|uniref:BTB domain-containing protein n=1 Tax=Elysia crispata TaxID=231223 RepID=A0AAE0ZY67_9GAST|nr:hypothetical protein RRG08_038097 [Elysia crispata]